MVYLEYLRKWDVYLVALGLVLPTVTFAAYLITFFLSRSNENSEYVHGFIWSVLLSQILLKSWDVFIKFDGCRSQRGYILNSFAKIEV